MGDIAVTTATGSGTAGWGSVYWQYFQELDKITSADTPLKVSRELFIEHLTDRGPQLTRVTQNKALALGDRLKARIVVEVDREMEYVHLKDMRGAGLEPVNVLSGYKWQEGIGYYETTKDVATHFFFTRLRRGKYVFEYPLVVSHKGDYSMGIATIQCMYAPEFTAHTAGLRMKVD
jgi:uncharacterized protein YfaS (alpha-2-macroglobulin family)